METKLSIRYHGPAVDKGAMDVYQVAKNMTAFSDFMVAATKACYGERAEVQVRVEGFGQGSFVTNLAFKFGGVLETLISSFSVSDVFTMVKESFSLWKHLKGEPPADVQQQEGQRVAVQNNYGQIINVHANTLIFTASEKGAEAAKVFAGDALRAAGVNGLEIRDGQSAIAAASRGEAGYFVPVAHREEQLSENVMNLSLVLISPVFNEGDKWRFSDGGQESSFLAKIEDEEFLKRVQAGAERFGEGDILDVRMRVVQKAAKGKMKLERFIEAVHKHREAPSQVGLW